MVLEEALAQLMENSCRKEVNLAPNSMREFWSFEDIFESNTREPLKKRAAAFAINTLLAPIYDLCRLLGKLGIKVFEKAAKGMRPYIKAAKRKEESFADWCDSKAKWRKYLRR